MTQQLGFRLLITSIPSPAIGKNTVRFLARLFPDTPPDKIAEKLEHLPFYLNRQPMAVAQAKPLVDQLQQLKVGFKVVQIHYEADQVPAPQPHPVVEEKRKLFSRLRKPKSPPPPVTPIPPAGSSTRSVIVAEPDKETLVDKAKQQLSRPVFEWSSVPRKLRLGLVVVPLLLLAGAAGGYLWLNPQLWPFSPEQPRSSHWGPEQARPVAGDSHLAKVRREWFYRYRLPPDGRFLEAQRQLVALGGAGGLPASKLSLVQFDWQLELSGHKPFTLSPFSSFEDHWERLKGLYSPIAHQGKVERGSGDDPLTAIRPVVGMFWAPAQLEALHLLHQAEGRASRPAEYHQLMAEALLNLALQSSDRTELRDGLFARALALAAAAEVEGADMAHLKALLAWSMGYEAAAQGMAVGLLKGDPVRLLVFDQGGRFVAEAYQGDASIRRRYLALMLLARQKSPALELRTAAARLFPKTAYEPAVDTLLLGLSDQRTAAQRLVTAVLDEMKADAQTKGRPEVAGGSPLASYEQLLAQHPAGSDPMDPDAIALEYWRQGLWNALWVLGKSYEGDAAASAEFAGGLTGEGPLAREFRELQLALGAPTPAEVRTRTSDLLISAQALPASIQFEVAIKAFGPTPEGRKGLGLLVERGDERPGHLVAFGLFAERILLDRNRANNYFVRALEAAPQSLAALEPRLMEAEQNHTKLRAILGDSSRAAEVRLRALDSLVRLKRHAPADGKLLYDNLLTQNPDDGAVYRRAIAYFEGLGDYDQAAHYLEAWLARLAPGAADHIDASYHKARLMRISGYADQAWQVIQPLAASPLPAVRHEAARAAFAAQQRTQAFTLAIDAYTKERSVAALLLNVELLWRAGAYQPAVDLIHSHGAAVTWTVWRSQLAPLFSQVFDKRPQEAAKCIEVLKAKGFFPYNMAQFALGLEHKDDPAMLGFVFVEALSAGDFGGLELQLEGFEWREKAQGFENALTWLQGRYTQEQMADLPNLFYTKGQYVLLWRFFDADHKAADTDRMWLLRAAAVVNEGDANHPKAKELEAHYQGRGSNMPHLLGRYLLGMETEETIVALGKDNPSAAQVAYYLGLKSAQQQRIQDASAWMQMARESGETDLPEYLWAGLWLQGRL